MFASEASDKRVEDPESFGPNPLSSSITSVRVFPVDPLWIGFDFCEGPGGRELPSDSASPSTSWFLVIETIHLDQSPGGPAFRTNLAASGIISFSSVFFEVNGNGEVRALGAGT